MQREEPRSNSAEAQACYQMVVSNFEECCRKGQGREVTSEGVHYIVEGSPGSGKSFFIVYWARKWVEKKLKVLILVPFRRLAKQLCELFVQLGTDPILIKVLEGPGASFQNISNCSYVISTYEHGYLAGKIIGQYSCVVIDEIHNIFYPKRGWQLEPFLDAPHLCLLSGTFKPGDKDLIKERIKLHNKKCRVGTYNINVFRRIEPDYRSISEWDDRDEEKYRDDGGVFYFFPQISSLVKDAYEYSKKTGIPIINPLSPDEIYRLRNKKAVVNLLRSIKVVDLLGENFIPVNYLIRKPTIYIDYSTHFHPEIRNLISKREDSKIHVFSTTTLCEGLNIHSLKAVVIKSGIWDWRRLQQIRGRAGRFKKRVSVYQGNFAQKEDEKLVLDLFDQISLMIRGQLNIIHLYKYYEADLNEWPNYVKNVNSLAFFLWYSGYFGVQAWLNNNFGVKLDIRYEDIVKFLNGQNSKEQPKLEEPRVAQNSAKLKNSVEDTYNLYFRPVLKMDVCSLFMLPQDDGP